MVQSIWIPYFPNLMCFLHIFWLYYCLMFDISVDTPPAIACRKEFTTSRSISRSKSGSFSLTWCLHQFQIIVQVRVNTAIARWWITFPKAEPESRIRDVTSFPPNVSDWYSRTSKVVVLARDSVVLLLRPRRSKLKGTWTSYFQNQLSLCCSKQSLCAKSRILCIARLCLSVFSACSASTDSQ